MGATAGNALIEYESSQELADYAVMTTANRMLYKAGIPVWSMRSGYEPSVRPDGIVSGSTIVYPTGENNEVASIAFTCYIGGALISVPADAATTVTRPTTGKAINIIIADAAGAVTAAKGTDGTEFSETFGAEGGPPEIPADKVLIGVVYLTGATAAPVTEAMIKQDVSGGHQERYDYPMFYAPNTLGDGNQADQSAKETAYLEFVSALPTNHASATAKKVWGKFYAPKFMAVSEAEEFKPAENAPSSTSKQIYQKKTIGAASLALGAASFKVYFEDGVTDPLKKLAGELLTFRYYPDMNRSPYLLTQGTIGFGTSFPVADFISATVTIAPRQVSVGFDE